jgi:hypothetical protein
MNKRLVGTALTNAAIIAAATLYTKRPTRASDHQDSPVATARPEADITTSPLRLMSKGREPSRRTVRACMRPTN